MSEGIIGSRKWNVCLFWFLAATCALAVYSIVQPWFAGEVPTRFDIGRLVLICGGYAVQLTVVIVNERARRKAAEGGCAIRGEG